MAVDHFMKDNTRILVRDGSCSFLWDNWSGQGCIADFYDIAPFSYLDVPLREVFGVLGWDPTLPDVLRSFVAPHSFSYGGGSDILIWEHSASGNFTLKTVYNALRPTQPQLPFMKYVWNSRIPLKLSFFVWRVLNGLLPYADVLVTFGFHLPSKCPWCDSADTLDHGLVSCVFAQHLWCWASAIAAVEVPVIGDVHSLLHFFWEHKDPHFESDFLHVLPLFVLWTLWTQRNQVLYDCSTTSAAAVRSLQILLLHVSILAQDQVCGLNF